MWTVIYISNTRQYANDIKKVLVGEGFLVKIKPVNKGDKEGSCEILVPRAEAEECYSALLNFRL